MPLQSIAEPPAGIASADKDKEPAAPAPSIAWWRSLSLTERLALAGRAVHEDGSEAGLEAGLEVDDELAEKRLARWRGKPFDDDELWQRRLALDGLDVESFGELLGESDASLESRAGETPAWVRRLGETYRSAINEDEPRRAFPWPEGANLERAPFLPVFEPLVWRAHGEIVRAVDSLETELFDAESAATALSLSLPDLLATIINRSLVVEMHIAKLEEKLSGETPRERFESFIAQLRDPLTAFEVLSRYPLMARQASIRIEQWRDASIVFLRDLARDEPRLRRELHGGRSLGRLVEARGDVSDSHRDGRGVLLLRFDSGFRTVYKPKPMRVEAAFQDLLDWLGERGLEPALRSVTVVDEGDHGYMQWIEAEPCSEEAALERFYRRQGAYLCLLWLLDGTDFHHENLIAAGEHPIFVDLETLFQPWVHFPRLDDVEHQPGGALRSSVLRTDLLPTRWWGTKEEAGIDMSGLASRDGQMTPRPVAAMTGRGTDEMRVERRRVEVPLADNRPRLEGEVAVSVLDYARELEIGFSALFDLVASHRDELLAAGGPLAAFEGAETRVLFRNTASYGSILLESYHPHLQGNALERDRLFDRLFDATRTRPFLESLIPFEKRDMERLDVPLFITRTDASTAWTWDSEPVRDRNGKLLDFGSTGLGRVRERIAKLDGAERVRQLAAIHDSLEALRLSSSAPSRPKYKLQEAESPATREALLEKAVEIGDRLRGRAFETENEALWLAVDYDEPGGWRLKPTGPDVFQGLPGIALFLGHLGAVTGKERFEATARRALWALEKQIERDRALVQGLGCFNGWGGVILAFTQLGVLWRDGSLLDRAESYAEPLADEISEDLLLDLVAGSAGLAAALLELHRHRPKPRLLELARSCGERLLATAEKQERGVGWKMPLAGNRVLAGMSHGAAGIALVLLRLYGATGDRRFAETAQQAFDFERHLFDPECGNWPDLRAAPAAESEDTATGEASRGAHEVHAQRSTHPVHAQEGAHEMHAQRKQHPVHAQEGAHEMHAWCHGAPGVGIARLMGLEFADDEEIHAEIDIAVKTTLESGLGQNHCLCHGDLGNLDFLLLAARRMGEKALEERVLCLAGGVLRSYEEDGPLFGLPGNLATPGLMTGLAGLGYGFLRLAAPEKVPSILAVESLESSPAEAET